VTDEFYTAATARILRLTILIGVAGALVAFAWRGPRAGGGFLTGAAISYVSLLSWKNLADSLGASAKPPARASAALLGSRYLIAAAIIYVIFKITGITLGAVFAGLLASLAAVLLEILYEVAFLRT